jgi:hypothetical protein
LNEKNGHSHDSYGFHYHLTVDKDGNPNFPYGPTISHHGCGRCGTSQCGQTSASRNRFCATVPSARPVSAAPSIKSTVMKTAKPSGEPTVAPTTVLDYSCLHANGWLLNAQNNYDYSFLFSAYTEILSSFGVSSSSTWQISSSQIPFYNLNVTAAIISSLNSRPYASSDFSNSGGRTTARLGKISSFGSSVGFVSSTCSTGYWPPGADTCPVPANAAPIFTLRPAAEVSVGSRYSILTTTMGI